MTRCLDKVNIHIWTALSRGISFGLSGRMIDIFISYSHKNKDQVLELVQCLEKSSLGVWWDERLPQGATWDEQIEAALEAATAVVVVWSKDAVRSENVKDEAHYALEEHKALPIRIEEVTLPYRWRRIQHVDLFTRPFEKNEKWKQIIDAIRQQPHTTSHSTTTEDSVTADITEPPHSSPRQRSVVNINAILPAIFVLLSVLANVLGPVLFDEESMLPNYIAIVFGIFALALGGWSIFPRKKAVLS